MRPSKTLARSIAFTLGLTLLAGCQTPPVAVVSTVAPQGPAASQGEAASQIKPSEWRVAKVGDQTQYLVEFDGDSTPKGFEKAITQAGGSVQEIYEDVGLASVLSSRSDFEQKAGKIPGVQSVVEDRVVNWFSSDGMRAMPVKGANNTQVGRPNFTYSPMQWGMKAIQAPEAWAEGATGKGVTVAVLDSGIDTTHSEFAGRIHWASRSFIKNDGPDGKVNSLMDLRGHGTHVAGIIAAAADGKGVTGVAPHARILALKVNDYRGESNFDQVIKGIVYAASLGADVINMSFGARFLPGDKAGEQLNRKMQKAVRFAFRRGAVVVSSVGNERTDYDTIPDKRIPAMLEHNIGVSATGPTGFAADGSLENVDAFAAFFSNSGKRIVDLSAPGGGVILTPTGISPAGLIYSTWSNYAVEQVVEGMPFQPAPYFMMGGTSMAAPHVAGVAALVISKRGQLRAQPKQVVETLFDTADDLGEAGFDAKFGEGRVNAFKAVSATKPSPGRSLLNLLLRLW
jgi:subtilisin family serine protease